MDTHGCPLRLYGGIRSRAGAGQGLAGARGGLFVAAPQFRVWLSHSLSVASTGATQWGSFQASMKPVVGLLRLPQPNNSVVIEAERDVEPKQKKAAILCIMSSCQTARYTPVGSLGPKA